MTKILISQRAPQPQASNQLSSIAQELGASIEYIPFFRIETLPSKDFRAQRVNLPDYTAIVFSSKSTIDAYFKMCEEMRFKVPDTMKYFCSTEAVAKYLQKHIIYRKRKIFFGTGTPESIIGEIGPKHTSEKFLIATSETTNTDIVRAFSQTSLNFTPAVFVRPVSEDIKSVKLEDYDALVFYNAADVRSLLENFPEYQQGNMKFIAFGKSTVKAMEQAGLKIEIAGPTPEVPSVCRAVEILLGK